MSKKCVVLTTVNPPTEAVREFIRTDYDVIIVGDVKTPRDYAALDCVFLDLRAQHKLFPALSALLPENSYARKNAGYLYALQNGYDLIAESDDDTAPYPHWGKLACHFSRTIVAPEYPNVYSLYTDDLIWPRGFPLEKINAGERIVVEQKDADVFVIQSLVDGDPDVDAIFRLVFGGKPRRFGGGEYALARGIVSPFNTQNTFWVNRLAFPYLYLPATVTFRYCDILRSYLAQHGIWQRGGSLGFTAASAHQLRNPHDLLADFQSEIPVYRDFHKVMKALGALDLRGGDDDLYAMYDALRQHGIVESSELRIVREWLKIATRALH